jgi:hypothetical protein
MTSATARLLHRLSRPRPDRRREGSSAVEFAMLALPFFFMMMCIIEIAFVFVLDSVLENATIESGRLLRTGQADTSDFSDTRFRDELCSRMSIFEADCDDRITIDVRVIPQFSSPNLPDPMSGGTFSAGGLGYDNGSPGSLMLVRAWYRHRLFTPFLEQGLSRLGDGYAYLSATTAFKNEPY